MHKKEGTDEYLIDFFFKTSIKRMEKEISEKVNMTKNFVSGMDFFKKKQADSEPEL